MRALGPRCLCWRLHPPRTRMHYARAGTALMMHTRTTSSCRTQPSPTLQRPSIPPRQPPHTAESRIPHRQQSGPQPTTGLIGARSNQAQARTVAPTYGGSPHHCGVRSPGGAGVWATPPAITVSAAHALRQEPPLPTRCTHHPKHRCTRQRPSDDGATPTSPQASPPSRQASQSHRLSPSATS